MKTFLPAILLSLVLPALPAAAQAQQQQAAETPSLRARSDVRTAGLNPSSATIKR